MSSTDSSSTTSATRTQVRNSYSLRITGVLNELATIVPVLEHGHKRGKSGKVCIVGGSMIHTGAPFYAGHSAICCGVDEVTVLTTRSAAIPIKCYSPALTVLGELPEEEGQNPRNDFIERVWPMVKNNHAFCIGPGLGRNPTTFNAVSKLIGKVRNSGTALVMDDDALWLLASEPRLLAKDIPKSPVIVTPNLVEFNRLYVSLSGVVNSGLASSNSSVAVTSPTPPAGTQSSGKVVVPGIEGVCWREIESYKINPVGIAPVVAVESPLSKSDVNRCPDAIAIQQTGLLASMIGNNTTVVRKGYFDLISTSSNCFILSQGQVPRRCGGQGSILAGLCTTFLAWMKLAGNVDNPLLAAEGAAIITRQAAQGAFERKDRSMQTPDIIAVLAGVMEEFLATSGVDALDMMVFEKEDLSEEVSRSS